MNRILKLVLPFSGAMALILVSVRAIAGIQLYSNVSGNSNLSEPVQMALIGLALIVFSVWVRRAISK